MSSGGQRLRPGSPGTSARGATPLPSSVNRGRPTPAPGRAGAAVTTSATTATLPDEATATAAAITTSACAAAACAAAACAAAACAADGATATATLDPDERRKDDADGAPVEIVPTPHVHPTARGREDGDELRTIYCGKGLKPFTRAPALTG